MNDENPPESGTIGFNGVQTENEMFFLFPPLALGDAVNPSSCTVD